MARKYSPPKPSTYPNYTGEIYGEWYSQLATLEETQQTMAQRLRVIMAKYDLARISMSLWAQDDPEEGIDWDVEAASNEGEAFALEELLALGQWRNRET